MNLDPLRDAIGSAHVLSGAQCEPYETGHRYGVGRAAFVACPGSIEAVQATVRFAVRSGIGLVIQGANTGLVAASTPDQSGRQAVLSTRRLNAIPRIDAVNRTVQVQAGVRLSGLNAALAEHELWLPIDLGSDPSIGGLIGANAAGARCIRYGDMRRMVLALDVVMADADATPLRLGAALRKHNAGLDLKQLFVGASGTLGVVVGADLEAQPLPRQVVELVVLPASLDGAVRIVQRLERELGPMLAAAELMSRAAIDAAVRAHPGLSHPLAGAPRRDHALLIELSTTLPYGGALDLAAVALGALAESCEGADASPDVLDAWLDTRGEARRLRHSISDGLRRLGRVFAFDVSVPRASLPALIVAARRIAGERWPTLRLCEFGHLADGGVHLNFVQPNDSVVPMDELREAVLDLVVHRFGGSFSAEHGVGPYNLMAYRRHADPGARAAAAALKHALDPHAVLGNFSWA